MAPQSKTHGKSKFNIRTFPADFPKELLDEILRLYLSGKTKWGFSKMYQELRMESRVCRKAYGNQECAKLFNDEDLEVYIDLCESFDKVFHHSINFGGLYFLDIMMPTTSALSSRLGDTLSTSGVIHLNIHCGHSRHFLQDLQTPGWKMALQRLQVFRIKYIVSVEENGENPHPWDHPLWIDLLSSCTSVQMLLLKTPLPIDDYTDIFFVDRWARNMHCLQRMYIFHGFDEEAGVADNFWIGSNTLYTRRHSSELQESVPFPSSEWAMINIRPGDFERGLQSAPHRWMPMLDEDVDIYDSDVVYASDSDVGGETE